jgi:O-antigen ligase
MAVSLVWVIVSNFVPGERLWVTAAGYNPNSLALVDLSAIVAAMAYRNVPIRCCILAVPVLATVLTDSRASGLGTIIALGVIILVRLKAAEHSTRNFMFIIMGIVILSAIYFRGQLSASFSDFFQLQDEYRGLDTGATGRSAAWSATWRLFVENPIFGVGFRAHEARLGVASSSHNGYLALLAEVGLVGFTSVIYLVATGAAFLYKRVASKDAVFCYSILFGLVAGYLVVAMFERYLLNVGNPTSLLFLVAITATCQNTADRSNAYDGGDARRHSILP